MAKKQHKTYYDMKIKKIDRLIAEGSPGQKIIYERDKQEFMAKISNAKMLDKEEAEARAEAKAKTEAIAKRKAAAAKKKALEEAEAKVKAELEAVELEAKKQAELDEEDNVVK